MILKDAWTVAHKDLRLFVRDRSALALTLLLPVVLATVFGAAMGAMSGGSGGAQAHVDLLVEDRDASPASEALLVSLEGTDALNVIRGEGSRRAVAGGEVPAALLIPKGYGETLARGELPELRLLRDPSQTLAGPVIAGSLLPVLLEKTLGQAGPALLTHVLEGFDLPGDVRSQAQSILNETWLSMDRVLSERGAPRGEGGGARDPAGGSGVNFLERVPALLGVVVEEVAGGGATQGDSEVAPSAGGSHAIASMAVMMLMFSLVAAGGTLLEEQATGTLLRLQLAPGGGSSILLGKLLSMGCIGLLQLSVLFAYGRVVFGVPILARPLALGLTAVGVVFAATGLGLLFATLCRTRKQLEGLSTLVILIMSAVGGAWFPREITPGWFRLAGQFTITAYAMDAFHGVLWYGKGLLPTAELGGIGADVAMLYATGAVLVWAAFRSYRRRFEGAG